MADLQDGTAPSRAPAAVSQAHAAALRKQLDDVIKRQRASDERERIAEQAVLAKRLSGPRPARNTEKGPEPFQPPEELRGRRSRFARTPVKAEHRYTQGPPAVPDTSGPPVRKD